MIICHENLRALAKEILTAAGSTGDEPQLVSDNLVEANLAGHDSHGIGMLPRYVASVKTGELIPNQHAKIAIDNGPLVTVDGGAGYGQVIGKEAMDIAIDRVREHGVCVMTIRRSFHLGRIGAWGERCAAAGFL
ncbi:MAG: Ldh family oxidoreductase, partial [Gammaproteobacteria bacterium]|nr:Ldh family oxidoreductase [Gammaproteobacteria bacterium]